MTTLHILQFPDPKLKLKAKPVTKVTDGIVKIAKDMLETMYEANGVGLAAIQVDIQQRIIVLDCSSDKTNPLIMINPEITTKEGSIMWEEGCLSFPGAYAKVKRAEKITVKFFNEKGEKESLDCDGLTSVCVQHEINHIDGITFYDHLSPLKKTIVRKQLAKTRDKRL